MITSRLQGAKRAAAERGELRFPLPVGYVHDEEGQTIIVITHDMNLAAEYCDRMIIMASGQVILDASTREAFSSQEALRTSSLRPPQVIRLGQALGYPGAWLTVDEALSSLNNVRIGPTINRRPTHGT